jgi:chromatin modification-related protein YNG2
MSCWLCKSPEAHVVQELQQEADKDSAKYIRHSLRASSSNPSSPSSRAPSPKSSILPAKISAYYAEIHILTAEKCVLAQTLVDLVTRTRARLDSDLVKVRILQGEASDYPGTLSSAASGVATPADAHVVTGRNPALQVGESLRTALAAGPILAEVRQTSGVSAAATPPSTASAGPVTKSAFFCLLNENGMETTFVFQ